LTAYVKDTKKDGLKAACQAKVLEAFGNYKLYLLLKTLGGPQGDLTPHCQAESLKPV
jgi:hypothetical protein